MTTSPDLSVAQQIALLDDEEREVALDGLDLNALQYDWRFWGRPQQIFPPERAGR